MKKLSALKLNEIHGQGVSRWGYLVMQISLMNGITESQWQMREPPGGHLVIREFRSVDPMISNVARDLWKNQSLEKIKDYMLDMLKQAEEMNLDHRDKAFCQQVISKIRKAIQMNRVRLKDLMDAWYFVFFVIRTPDRVEQVEDRFE
jgi:hypothetical protein